MTQQQVFKWLAQWALLIFYHILCFWYFPLSSNIAIYGTPYCLTTSSQYSKYGCFDFRQNGYLIIFYLIFCYYFMLSALQIRHGYPDWRLPSSLTTVVARHRHIAHLIFYNLPFLVELKTILDWCWSKTSLDLMQWLELAEINVAMYNNRNSNKVNFEKPLGEKTSKCEKMICGCFCLTSILFFLVGPFLFFSNLSTFAKENLVNDVIMDFHLKIRDTSMNSTYEFPMFYVDSPIGLNVMNEDEFKERGYSIMPETKFFEASQVQKIYMMNTSDYEWDLASDYMETYDYLLSEAQQPDSGMQVLLEFAYTFTRPVCPFRFILFLVT